MRTDILLCVFLFAHVYLGVHREWSSLFCSVDVERLWMTVLFPELLLSKTEGSLTLSFLLIEFWGMWGAPVVWGSILGFPVLSFQYHLPCCSANDLRTPQLPPGAPCCPNTLTLLQPLFLWRFHFSSLSSRILWTLLCLLSFVFHGLCYAACIAFIFVSCTCLLSKISPGGTEGWGLLPSYFLVTQGFVLTVHPESFTRWSSSMF